MRTGQTMSVGNCPNKSAIQKYTALSNSKAVARFKEAVFLEEYSSKNNSNGVSISLTKDKAVLQAVPFGRSSRLKPKLVVGRGFHPHFPIKKARANLCLIPNAVSHLNQKIEFHPECVLPGLEKNHRFVAMLLIAERSRMLY
jgi:hypothetical protein